MSKRSEPSTWFLHLVRWQTAGSQRSILDPEKQIGHHAIVRTKDTDLLHRFVT